MAASYFPYSFSQQSYIFSLYSNWIRMQFTNVHIKALSALMPPIFLPSLLSFHLSPPVWRGRARSYITAQSSLCQ